MTEFEEKILKRLDDIEDRLQHLEIRNRRLGPQPHTEQSRADETKIVERILESVKNTKEPKLPVDYSARVLLDGSSVTNDHREIQPSGMQKSYVVLSDEELAKGFVKPVRNKYRHAKCGEITTMGSRLAETYARAPDFYSGTFCASCGTHFTFGEPDGDFFWLDGEQLGS
jgi:hypothetical protein